MPSKLMPDTKQKITLDQWHSLITVVESGGYAQAAEQMAKSQSAISYAIQKMESTLNLQIFKLEGRKAVLTDNGQALYRRAKQLISNSQQLEALASQLSLGWEDSITVACDVIFPEQVMLRTIGDYSRQHPSTRITYNETVLSGSEDMLIKRQADIAITGIVPAGFFGQALLQVKFILAAAPSHPLHQIEGHVSEQDLYNHRQLVVKDSGQKDMDGGWVQAPQRLTVNSMSLSINAAIAGLGFAWYPQQKIQQALEQNLLAPLSLPVGAEKFVQLYLVQAKGELAGPASREFARKLSERVAHCC